MIFKEWKRDPNLKRNVLVLAVLVFVATAAYLNWSYNQRWSASGSAMADAEDQMTTAVNAILGRDTEAAAPAAAVSGYFSQARRAEWKTSCWQKASPIVLCTCRRRAVRWRSRLRRKDLRRSR